MRKIPATMATQHPDNAKAPYWERDGDGFVSVAEEISECASCFQELGVQEFMWDWEGKYADEAVIDKLFSNYYDYFRRQPLGRDIFLTFRLPNVWQEKGYSLIRALMVILTSEDFARDLHFPAPPLFEAILPMTERAGQLIYIQRCFRKLARFKSRTFNHAPGQNTDYVRIIPLLEGVENQVTVFSFLKTYLKLHQKHFGRLDYLRLFLAHSDPALVSGMAATVLANKVALSEIEKFSQISKIPIYPIMGVGSLVFRGGLNPKSCRDFVQEFRGVKTVTIQSAFRYDYPLSQVRSAIAHLNQNLWQTKARIIPANEIKIIKVLIDRFTLSYQRTLVGILRDLDCFFNVVPRRRERRLHIGFLSYQRKMDKYHLPRAITFTAALYSLGVPPEFIGLGRTLADLSEKELGLTLKYHQHLAEDMKQAGQYLNKENLALLAKKNVAWRKIEEDVEQIERIFKIKLGPKTQNDFLHKNLTANVLLLKAKKEVVGRLIVETGKIRQSLG